MDCSSVMWYRTSPFPEMYKERSVLYRLELSSEPYCAAFCLSVYGINASLNESHMQKAVHLRIPLESQCLTCHVLGIWLWWLDFPGSRTVSCHGQRPTRNAGENSKVPSRKVQGTCPGPGLCLSNVSISSCISVSWSMTACCRSSALNRGLGLWW